MKTVHQHGNRDEKITGMISYLFMFLVGLSTPQFIGIDHGHRITEAVGIIAAQPMPSWEVLIVHVIVVTLLSNLGKMFPLFFYRDWKRDSPFLSVCSPGGKLGPELLSSLWAIIWAVPL